MSAFYCHISNGVTCQQKWRMHLLGIRISNIIAPLLSFFQLPYKYGSSYLRYKRYKLNIIYRDYKFFSILPYHNSKKFIVNGNYISSHNLLHVTCTRLCAMLFWYTMHCFARILSVKPMHRRLSVSKLYLEPFFFFCFYFRRMSHVSFVCIFETLLNWIEVWAETCRHSPMLIVNN